MPKIKFKSEVVGTDADKGAFDEMTALENRINDVKDEMEDRKDFDSLKKLPDSVDNSDANDLEKVSESLEEGVFEFAYDCNKIEQILKDLSNDWHDSFTSYTSYEKEKDCAVTILKKYYNTVEVGDARTTPEDDMCWFITCADPRVYKAEAFKGHLQGVEEGLKKHISKKNEDMLAEKCSEEYRELDEKLGKQKEIEFKTDYTEGSVSDIKNSDIRTNGLETYDTFRDCGFVNGDKVVIPAGTKMRFFMINNPTRKGDLLVCVPEGKGMGDTVSLRVCPELLKAIGEDDLNIGESLDEGRPSKANSEQDLFDAIYNRISPCGEQELAPGKKSPAIIRNLGFSEDDLNVDYNGNLVVNAEDKDYLKGVIELAKAYGCEYEEHTTPRKINKPFSVKIIIPEDATVEGTPDAVWNIVDTYKIPKRRIATSKRGGELEEK